jgi:hypothetical protein
MCLLWAECQECFEELSTQCGLEILEIQYLRPLKGLINIVDIEGSLVVQGTFEQMQNLLSLLEKKRWFLGSSGRCYAKKDILVFHFQLQHLCRSFDETIEREGSR